LTVAHSALSWGFFFLELLLSSLRTSQARNTRIAHRIAAAAISSQADRLSALARL
jgi:hypothetical protein